MLGELPGSLACAGTRQARCRLSCALLWSILPPGESPDAGFRLALAATLYKMDDKYRKTKRNLRQFDLVLVTGLS